MILKAFNIVKSFGKRSVLKDVSFQMERGTLYGIVGENGSGKSTLLKIIVGEWKADSGQILIDGKLGYCPQKVLVFPELTVAENFRFFSSAYQLEKKTMDRVSSELMEHFHFENYANERVSNLSGGTQQKLNLSISLIHEPDLLILDEPYNGFDWDTYLKFWDYTNHLRDRGCTILVVTHMLSEKERFDRIFELKNGCLL